MIDKERDKQTNLLYIYIYIYIYIHIYIYIYIYIYTSIGRDGPTCRTVSANKLIMQQSHISILSIYMSHLP